MNQLQVRLHSRVIYAVAPDCLKCSTVLVKEILKYQVDGALLLQIGIIPPPPVYLYQIIASFNLASPE